MKLLKFDIVLISVILLYSSCCSLRGTSVKHYYFKSEQTEELVNKQPDSITFINQQNVEYAFQTAYRFEIDTKNECHQCCEDNEIEKKTISYYSDSLRLGFTFDLKAEKNADYLTFFYFKLLELDNNTTYYNDTYSFVKPNLRADSLYSKLYPEIIYHDTLTILDKQFNDVFEFEEYVATPTIYANKVYYNTTKGIVGIRFSNDDIWRLKD